MSRLTEMTAALPTAPDGFIRVYKTDECPENGGQVYVLHWLFLALLKLPDNFNQLCREHFIEVPGEFESEYLPDDEGIKATYHSFTMKTIPTEAGWNKFLAALEPLMERAR